MKSYDLLDSIVTALATDAQLTTYANNWYGADHQVYIDQDQENPPGEDEGYVLIHLHSPSKNGHEESRTPEHGFYLAVDVQDPADAVRSESNASEFSATKRLDEIVMRIIEVIRATKPGNWAMGYDYETDTITAFPMFTADILITFVNHLTIGEDPLA